MKTKTRKEIRIETREMIVIRHLNRALIAWCERCGVEVRVTPPTQLAAITGKTQEEVYRWLEQGSIHYVETSDDTKLICLQSMKTFNPNAKGICAG